MGMNANAPVFNPQGVSGNQTSGNNGGGITAIDSKKSSARTASSNGPTRAISDQKSQAGRGKGLKNGQRNGQRRHDQYDGHERESRAGSTTSNANTIPAAVHANNINNSKSSFSSDLALLSSSMAQLTTSEKAKVGSKRQQVSLNHLLNFSFPVREEPPLSTTVRRRRNVNYQPFNKERFINANFRFMLNPKSDYSFAMMTPDVQVNWEDIEQVILSTPQSCPICLQPPTAARVTKCGHLYCFSCILHYLALSETNKPWRKCPICWDAIYEKDLKSVRTIQPEGSSQVHDEEAAAAQQGEKEIARNLAANREVWIDMKLVYRSLASTLALPRSLTWPLPTNSAPSLSDMMMTQPPPIFYPDAMVFSRLLTTSTEKILSELDRDLTDIEFSIEESRSYGAQENSEEIVFLEMAREKIRDRQGVVKQEAKFLPKSALDREQALLQMIDRHNKKQQQRQQQGQEARSTVDMDNIKRPSIVYHDEAAITNTGDFLSSISATVESEALVEQLESDSNVTVSSSAPTLTSTSIPLELDLVASGSETSGTEMAAAAVSTTAQQQQKASPNTFYFYQASSGHHLYLQPLDIRILKQHFETYDKFPDNIKVRVFGIEETSLTEEVRKRCKYLSHLPLGCEVSFLDVDLEKVVGAQGLQPFSHELGLRRNKRREKDAREERERAEQEAQQNPRRGARQAQGGSHGSLAGGHDADDVFANDPFFQVGGTVDHSRAAQAATDLETALLVSSLSTPPPSANDALPLLSEAANIRTKRGGRHVPIPEQLSGAGNGNNRSNATVWGTPSVPVTALSRSFDDSYYDDDYEENDYEPEIVVKRGKKKVAVLMSNGSRRSGK